MASPKEGRKRKRSIDDTSQVEENRGPKKPLSQLPSPQWDRHKEIPSSNMQFLSNLDADSVRRQRQRQLQQLQQPQAQLQHANTQFLHSLFTNKSYQHYPHKTRARQARQANTQFLLSQSTRSTPRQAVRKDPVDPPALPLAEQINKTFLPGRSTAALLEIDRSRRNHINEKDSPPVVAEMPGALKRKRSFADVEFLQKLTRPQRQVDLGQSADNKGYPALSQPYMPSNGLVHNDSNTDKPSESANKGTSTGFLKNSELQQKHGDDHELLNTESTANDVVNPAISRGARECFSSNKNVAIPNVAFTRGQNTLNIDLSPPHQRLVSNQPPSPLFIYPPLVNEKSSIRLLRIDHGPALDMTGEIYCHLVSLDSWINQVKYNCLSYCWGDTSLDKRIFVRTTDATYDPMYITQNLHNALQDLWGAPESTFYWIDAICIDQTDNAERGEQVRLMKQIFDNASGVIVLLGSSTARLSAAVDTVEEISKQFEEDTHMSPDMVVDPSGLQLTVTDIEKLKSYTNHAYGEVAHFFSLPWFRRVWVLQEAFSQTKISVRLGTRTLPWGSVILAALWQAQLTYKHTQVPPSHDTSQGDRSRQYFPELWLSLMHTRMPRGLTMIELTSRAREFEATDPRDKVFSLLGLANDLGPLETRPLGLVPDYTKSTTEVYANFARAIILKTGKLDVLSLVNTFQGQTTSQNVASWIPHLNAPVPTIRGLGFPTKYDASSSTNVRLELTGGKQERVFVLTLAGYCIDRVSFLTDNVMSFSRNFKVYTGENKDAVVDLWRAYMKPPVDSEIPEIKYLLQHLELITATGVALPTEFPVQPLGRVVPTRDAPSTLKDFAAYWARLDPDFIDFQATARAELQVLAKLGDADQFGVLAGKACHERKFFITANGRAGLCPRATQVGDEVVILYGGSVPYVLRKATTDGEWRFIGECYVNGVMFGETETSREKEEERVFDIV